MRYFTDLRRSAMNSPAAFIDFLNDADKRMDSSALKKFLLETETPEDCGQPTVALMTARHSPSSFKLLLDFVFARPDLGNEEFLAQLLLTTERASSGTVVTVAAGYQPDVFRSLLEAAVEHPTILTQAILKKALFKEERWAAPGYSCCQFASGYAAERQPTVINMLLEVAQKHPDVIDSAMVDQFLLGSRYSRNGSYPSYSDGIPGVFTGFDNSATIPEILKKFDNSAVVEKPLINYLVSRFKGEEFGLSDEWRFFLRNMFTGAEVARLMKLLTDIKEPASYLTTGTLFAPGPVFPPVSQTSRLSTREPPFTTIRKCTKSRPVSSSSVTT